MNKLLQFLIEFRALLVFLALEAVAFIFIVNFNRYHAATFFNSSNQVTGEFYGAKDDVLNYWKLDEENDSLALENAKLKSVYYSLVQQLQKDSLNAIAKEQTYAFIQDSLKQELKSFEVWPAKIIKNSVRQTHNFLTLNKGKKDGIHRGMGVINNIGVIGRVHAVSNHFATVTSLLHTRLMISSKIGAEEVLCTTKWDGDSPQYAQVIYVPSHVTIKEGDWVKTSGFDGIFPADTPIGQVVTFEINRNSGFHKIRIQLANDFHKIHYVEVVKNIHQQEIDSIQQISL